MIKIDGLAAIRETHGLVETSCSEDCAEAPVNIGGENLSALLAKRRMAMSVTPVFGRNECRTSLIRKVRP